MYELINNSMFSCKVENKILSLLKERKRIENEIHYYIDYYYHRDT